MNTITKITFTIFCILAFHYTQAQNTFKEPGTFKLKNGMTIIVSENSQSEKAISSLTLDDQKFAKKDGIVELMNVVLNENLAKGSNISFNDNSAKLAAAPADFDKDLTTMASVIQNAVIDQKAFEAGKAKLLSSLKAGIYDYDSAVTEQSIQALTLKDVREFYNQISPEKTFLVIAGNVNMNDARNSAKKAFGNWIKVSTPASAPVTAK